MVVIEASYNPVIQPSFAHKLNYQTQYLETDFQYLQRLAKTYNEWLFYDGEKLFFGKPKKEGKRIKLTYNKDLYSLNILLLTNSIIVF